MEKEEILKQSRNENKGADELELTVITKAGELAAGIGMIVCGLVAALQAIIADYISIESWVIYFSIVSTASIVKYVKLRKKRDLVFSIIYSTFLIIMTVIFAIRLFGLIYGE